MHKARSITAIFLLFAYFVGFVHTLVPHSHKDEVSPVAFLYQEGDFSHNENADSNSEHHHIKHKSHQDEGIWGFLSCVMQKISHSKSLDTYVKSDTNIEFDFDQIVVLKECSSDKVVAKTSSIELDKSEDTYLNKYNLTPIVSSLSHRGPPSISC